MGLDQPELEPVVVDDQDAGHAAPFRREIRNLSRKRRADPGAGAEAVTDHVHQGASDDDAVRVGGHLGHLGPCGNAKPDRHRKPGVGAYARHRLGDAPRQPLAHAGDALPRDVVDEAGRRRRNLGEP